MAITVDWPNKVINVPRADMLLVQGSPEIRELDLNTFRLALKSLEDDEEGIVFLRTHNHNPPVSIGGLTLGRVVEIINGYTVTFEDGQYAVRLTGANTNLAEKVNVNQVSVRSNNSAGLVVVGSAVTAQDKLDIAAAVRAELTLEMAAVIEARKLLRNKRVIDRTTGIETVYDDNGQVLYTRQVYTDEAGTTTYDGTQAPHRVERYA